MKVTYYPASKAGKGKSIEKFLVDHHVKHDLVASNDKRRVRMGKLVDLPTVEVDGRIFVNPNDHALRKILALDPADAD